MENRWAEREWISAATVDWVLAAAAGIGCSPPPMRWRAGMPLQNTHTAAPKRPILATEFTPVLQACLEELGARARGPDARIAIFKYGNLLSACVVNSPSLHAAISQGLLFIRAVQGEKTSVHLSTSSDVASFSLPRSPGTDAMAALVVDFFELASYYKLFSLLIGESLRGQVTLAHTPVAEAAALNRIFACPVRFGGRENCITFEASLLKRPLCLSHAQLTQQLQSCAVALLPLPGQRISARLEMLIRRALETSAPIAYADQIARQYGRSGPTLRRQLLQEGTTFRSLLNKCRMERAAELLSATNLTIEQIAHRLSFSTASGFSRAFKGWTGKAPAAFRAPARALHYRTESLT